MPHRAPRRRAARTLTATLAALALAATLAACGGGGGEGDGDAAAGGDGGGFPRTIKHAMGQTEIPARPQRIVTLDSSFTDAAITLETRVAGRINYTGSGELPDYLGEDGQTYAGEAVSVGDLEAPDLPAIAELEPDLIISAKVRHEDVYDQLAGIAPTVFSETTGGQWKDNIRLLARALGKEDLAEEKIAAYEERARTVGDAIRAKEGRNPTISLVRFVGGPTVRLYTPHSFPGIVQQDLGLARREGAPDDPSSISVDLSQEEILELDADHIFIASWDDGTGAPQREAERFAANPLWGRLKGTKHEIQDKVWYSAVSLQGAHGIIDDIAEVFGVDPAPVT